MGPTERFRWENAKTPTKVGQVRLSTVGIIGHGTKTSFVHR
jgi:hypothetical protein